MHQRVSQPRCRHSPRASLQYPVHGPCVAVLAAPGFHRGDRQKATPFSCPSCQTLGVTRNMSVNFVHRAFACKPSRQAVQCVSASAEPHVRAMPTLRPRPEKRPLVAVAEVVGYSLKIKHVLLATTARRPFELSWCRRWRAVEGKCWSVCGRCRAVKVGATLEARCGAAAGSVAFNRFRACLPS